MSEDITQLLLLIVDISGYTKFMVAHKKALRHGQIIISEITRALLKEVDLPLKISKLEGDAIFMYMEYGDVQIEIWEKLIIFLKIFTLKIDELSRSSVCDCSSCSNIKHLKLKMVLHFGEAIISDIAGFTDLSGVDVIIVHRLLKNSVDLKEYILLTETAYSKISSLDGIEFKKSSETYDEIGTISTLMFNPKLNEEITTGFEKKKNSNLTLKLKNVPNFMINNMFIKLNLKHLPKFNHLHDSIEVNNPHN